MKIKAVKLVVALTAHARGSQSALIDMDNPADTRLVKSIVRDDARGGIVIQLQNGCGVTSKRPEPGAPGDSIFVPWARVEQCIEVPDAPPAEAKKAAKP